ncbi:hypothetical protein FALBO_15339 [Fusarium albosuccineum]|uniref:Uncharacterized protein n=1 Tax=Fusarium albosuccineum TaxID=1237068 RepID=A0A8H4KSR8_9HYPO|nr:hypothetical protein FALBO_15339 [Fusarium albosuccineum]KAF4985717.1 hypothetical protein FDECE_16357 [Fusarium decemcellulare]
MAPQTAAEKAKAKLQAVLDNPGRNDASSYKHRVMSTKYPTAGGSDMTNMVTRRDSNARRESVSSEGSAHQVQRRWSMVKEWMNRPAY